MVVDLIRVSSRISFLAFALVAGPAFAADTGKFVVRDLASSAALDSGQVRHADGSALATDGNPVVLTSDTTSVPARPATLLPAADNPPAPLSKVVPLAEPQPIGAVGDRPAAPTPPPAEENRGALAPIPDAKYAGPAEVQVTAFHGVTPGATTRDAVEKTWGKPKESRKQDGNLVQLYAIDPFPRVEVIYTGERVSSLVIRFEHGYPSGQVAEQLDLTKVQPVLVSNELGEVLGQSYPERGVLFSFEAAPEPGKQLKKVTHIILEPITAEPFILRAETNIDVRPEFALHDVNEALKLQPNVGKAHWLRSRALTALGEYEKAMDAAADATRLEPKDARYLVTAAQTMAQAGHAEEAITLAEKAVTLAEQRPHVRARALCVLGDLKALSHKPDYKQALQFHTRAVQMADTLTTSPHPAIRMAAKETLLDGHLNAAHDIAWGEWREKERSVTNWLNRAAAVAQDLVSKEEGGDEYRFRLASRALSAYVDYKAGVDPALYAKEVLRSGDAMIATASEPARKSQLQWEVAMALYDALQVYQMRSDQEAALHYGEAAISYLEKSGRQGQSASSTYLLGRIYFRIGAVYAINQNDHRTAVTWFEKCVPLLGKSPPSEALNDLGRLGDTFVSMGVSYWKTGQRDKALALTQHGATLMEEAVRRGVYERSVLLVPYTNLAAMNRELGKTDDASRMEHLAEQIKTLR